MVTATAYKQIVVHDICGSLPANAMFMRPDSSIALTGKFSNVFCSALLRARDKLKRLTIAIRHTSYTYAVRIFGILQCTY